LTGAGAILVEDEGMFSFTVPPKNPNPKDLGPASGALAAAGLTVFFGGGATFFGAGGAGAFLIVPRRVPRRVPVLGATLVPIAVPRFTVPPLAGAAAALGAFLGVPSV